MTFSFQSYWVLEGRKLRSKNSQEAQINRSVRIKLTWKAQEEEDEDLTT